MLYFWAVAKEGSITRAGERLGLSVQTISTQLSLLERQLGQALFAPQGRSLVLTESGRTVLVYAEQIFQIGGKLLQAVAENAHTRPRFSVGITDAVPKLIAFRLMEIVLQPPLKLRLECIEGDFEHLLGELALNRLDLVIADRSAPQRANLKLDSHLLGNVGISLFGSAALCDQFGKAFPQQLDGAPMLLPARNNPLRGAIDAWLESHEICPEIVGEFSGGLGLFPAPAAMHADILTQFQAHPLGPLQGVSESWYAISTHKRVPHPAIQIIENLGGQRLIS